MPLYGHELSESNPSVSGRVDFAVNLEGHYFQGPERWRKPAANRRGYPRRLEAGRQRVPREADPVLSAEGQRSARGRAAVFAHAAGADRHGYCQPAFAKPEPEVLVDIRGRTSRHGCRIAILSPRQVKCFYLARRASSPKEIQVTPDKLLYAQNTRVGSVDTAGPSRPWPRGDGWHFAFAVEGA